MISFDSSDDARAAGARPVRTRDVVPDDVARLLEGHPSSAHAVLPYGASDPDLLDLERELAEPDADDPEPAQAPLRRYLLWQARDFLKQRAVWLGIIGLFAIYLLWDNYDASAIAGLFAADPNARMGNARTEAGFFANIVSMAAAGFAFLGGIFAVHGLVSAERERGLQRFLFAKPIGVVPYYLQKLGVSLVGVLAVIAALTFTAGLVMLRAVPLDVALLNGAAIVTMVGGLTFLLSTLVRFEGLLAFALCLSYLPVRALAEVPRLEWLRPLLVPLRYVLPPMPALAGLLEPFGGRPEIPDPVTAAVWLIGYGLVCIAGGVAILRRRSIVT